ncbi:hypothetical protein [Aureimonas altamirensis]|uniref:hypothetical protein n=1 Tax=Aureimonas altamirensis TaxID=370622 RepID=UPI0030184595
MSDFHDEDLSELERRMREKLLPAGSEPVRSRLSEEDQRIAAKLMGRSNAERISNAREGRRVRVAPVRITYEWYWFRVNGGYSGEHYYWRINRVENGSQRVKHASGSSVDSLEETLEELRNKGIHVVDANTELEGRPSRKNTSKRKSFAERFGGVGR